MSMKRNQEKLQTELREGGYSSRVQQQVLGATLSPSEVQQALSFAVDNDHLQVVRLLLQEYSTNIPSDYRFVLITATAHGRLNMVKLLLQQQANFLDSDVPSDLINVERDALDTAFRCGHSEIAELLFLKLDRVVQWTNESGAKVLFKAACHGHARIVKHLLERKVDVNMVDREEETPLYAATKYGKLQVVKILLEHNAAVNSTNGEDITPLDATIFSLANDSDCRSEIRKLLLTHGGFFNTNYSFKDDGIPSLLLEEFPDALQRPNSYRQFPLHLACRGRCSAESIRLMIEAFPEAATHSDDKGKLPLHHACENHSDSDEVIRLLVSRFPETATHSDNEGQLALHCACRCKSGDPYDVIRLLVETFPGALRHSDRTGYLPLHHICTEQLGSCCPVDLIKSMAQHFPDAVHCRDQYGKTPLSYLLSEKTLRRAIPWIKKRRPDQRTILSLKQLQRDNPDRTQLKNWDNIVGMLWYYHDRGQDECPPRIAETFNLSDAEFLDRYKWMVHAACSFLVSGDSLIAQLCRVYSEEVALEFDQQTGLTPLLAALQRPPDGNDNQAQLESGLKCLMDWNGAACRIRHLNGRLPLAFAIEARLSWRILEQMIKAWPALVQKVDVDGSPWWELAARSNCSLSVVYNLLCLSPDTLASRVVV